ncbi:MAG: DUF1501 domain-containing protein [Armatimonas sp.]
MQLSAPEATDLAARDAETLRLYGPTAPTRWRRRTRRNAILSRRLLERGVRFVQLYCGACTSAVDGLYELGRPPDPEGRLRAPRPILDRPTAALLTDLKRRGLLDDTLVLWTTEFGRMPTRQVGSRRSRPQPLRLHRRGWPAAGVKPGFQLRRHRRVRAGRRVQDVATIYDFHATVLHLLGIDHKRLTYYHNGANRRLTDVHGEVIPAVLQ